MSYLLAVFLCLVALNVIRKGSKQSQNTIDRQKYFHPIVKALIDVGNLKAFAHMHSMSPAGDFNTTVAELTGKLRPKCLENVLIISEGAYKFYQNETTDMEPTLLQLIDSNAARGAGILRGGLKFYGFKQECDIISYNVSTQARFLTTMYSRAFVNTEFADKSVCNASTHFINFDFCLPSTCNSADINYILEYALTLANVTVNPICRVLTIQDVTQPYNTGSWIVGIFVASVAVVVIFAGIVDYLAIFKEGPQHLVVKAFLAFSLYKNTAGIFSGGEARPGQITTLNCMRVISMLWVILLHTFEQFSDSAYNTLDFYPLLNYFFSELILNSFFSVDTFLFMGGLVVSYSWFKSYYKNETLITNRRSWIMFYVHRFLRLSPSYYMMILAYTYLLLPYMSGSVVFLIPGYREDPCVSHGYWTDLLYVNNIASRRYECIGHTWYLNVDMQLFILTPIVLIPLALYRYGYLVPLILWCLSTAANIFIIYLEDWPPTFPFRANIDLAVYFQLLYAAFWMRAPIYIQGLVVGWFLQSNKRLRVPKLLNIALWGLSGALMFIVIFGLFCYFSELTWMMPLFWRAMYSALSRPAWGVGLTWIVVSCFYGYGGPINQFMSWNIWNPFGKLTYCVYLVHYPLITYFYSLLDNAVYFNNVWSTVFYYFIPMVAIGTVAGYIWTVLFEIPFGKLEAIFLRVEKRDTIKISMPVSDLSGENNAY